MRGITRSFYKGSMRIFLIGLPGSGKTTQAKKIASQLGLCLIKTGELIRDYALNNPEIKKTIDSGNLVPSNLAAELVKEKIEEKECEMGFVVDGYPRSLEQLDVFDPRFNKVFFLKLSLDEIKNRLSKRGREDDTEESVEQRIKVQERDLQPILDYYKKSSQVVEIDAAQDEESVFNQIKGNI